MGGMCAFVAIGFTPRCAVSSAGFPSATSTGRPPSATLQLMSDKQGPRSPGSVQPWQVLLLGGASGVGKTSVSYRLAHHYGVGLTEVDDFQIVLERITTPEQLPAVHWWRTHPEEAAALDGPGLLAHTLAYGAAVADTLDPVISNHLDPGAPLLLEGDFLLPALAARSQLAGREAGGRVAAVFLYEPDEQQILANYRAREASEPRRRAHASWDYSEWLRQECRRLGLPAVAARPWDTGLARVIAAVDSRWPAAPSSLLS